MPSDAQTENGTTMPSTNRSDLRVFDVIVPEESGSGKTYWKPVGVTFKRPTGEGMTLRLFMFPGVNFIIRERPASVAREEARKALDSIPF